MRQGKTLGTLAGLGTALFLVGIGIPAVSTAAFAEVAKAKPVIVAPDVDAFLAVVKKHKDVAEATTDTSDKEYPFIRVKTKSGSTFFLDFEECDENFKDCGDLWLSASWGESELATLEMLNEWNRTAYSYAYLNKSKKPVLSDYLALEGGLVEENLTFTLSSFMGEINSFSKKLSSSGIQQQN